MAKQAYVTYKNVRNPDRGWEHRYPSVTCRGGGFDVPSQTRYRKQEMWQFGMFSALALTAGYVSFRGLQYLFFTPEGVAVQVKF